MLSPAGGTATANRREGARFVISLVWSFAAREIGTSRGDFVVGFLWNREGTARPDRHPRWTLPQFAFGTPGYEKRSPIHSPYDDGSNLRSIEIQNSALCSCVSQRHPSACRRALQGLLGRAGMGNLPPSQGNETHGTDHQQERIRAQLGANA